ncbi:MAG: type VI secretion system protein TssA [Polyangia bacterium]
MAAVDVDVLVSPVPGSEPCGPDLEYGDPAFAVLERAAQGKPEQQIGSTIVPAEPPDWKAVGRQASELLSRTKDLRIAVHLAKALLHTDGLKGFAAGLTVIDKIIQSFWDGVHPRLDPDDDNDPTMRLNILATLAAPDTLAALRATPLVSSRTLGRFAYKDLEAATSAAPNAEAAGASVAAIDAAAMDSDLAELQSDTAAAGACVAALVSLDAALTERVGSGSITGLPALSGLAQKIANFLKAALTRRSPAAASAVEGGADVGAASNSATPQTISSLPGEIGSREDVLRTLDKIAAYYTRHEPSSPIPLFIERCKKLVTMSFIDIVKELVPDAATQVGVLTGHRSE